MSVRGTLVLVVALLAVAAFPIRGDAQTTVAIELPREDPFPAAPEITVRAGGFPLGTQPRVRLRLSLNASFGLVVLDSVIAAPEGRFTVSRLLPENADIFVEASVLNSAGQTMVTQTVLPAGRTGRRLSLLSPNGRTSVTLLSRLPQFAWKSASVTSPPGPWVYELSITNVALQETRSQLGITDTVFVIPDSLQANTSYRWKVIARLADPRFALDSAVASSESSFIIAPSGAPDATLLYQNFPNPFPNPSSQTTCIWFDLHRAAQVELTILDLRGNKVKTLIPGQLPAHLEPGRYGRKVAASGCDDRLAWDGTADNGRQVPGGVYLVRLTMDGKGIPIKKIVYWP
ncbi:MAG: hypothetical protein V4550_05445 [Gemmatimonadota bacterium]